MKKVVGPCCAVLVLLCVCGYLFTRRASARSAAKQVAVAPAIPPTPASGDLAKVLDACGAARSDNTQPDTMKIFAGKMVRTIEYGNGDVSKETWVSLRFDQPASGWRFRGASRGSGVNDGDLSFDQLKGLLPCAAVALDYEPPVDKTP